MSEDGKPDAKNRTVLDQRLARPRLQEGLVPHDTGIYLRIEEGDGKGKSISLSAGGVYVIGREGADIVLDDGKVSRKHAQVGLYGPGAFVLRDLASTNGTFLNGKRVSEKRALNNGDLIRIGDTVLRLTILENSIPLST
jgi:pSer/pThr/pTyr-binding forkhead associated (FHA) protein